MEIKSEQVVPMAEVKKILAKREEERELVYEQKVALDYLKKFSKVAPTKAAKLVEELATVGKLNEKQVVAIANFLPEDLDDLRILFSSERLDLSPEDKKKILGIVKDNS